MGCTDPSFALQIHDEDFPRLASGQLPDNSNALPRLLGVTNLYFLKAVPSWPSVLSTGRRAVLQRSTSDSGLQAPPPPEAKSRFGSAVKAVRRRAAGAQILMTDHVEQLWLTGYRWLARNISAFFVRTSTLSEGCVPAAESGRICPLLK